MAHFHIRAEERENERRTPVTPASAAALVAQGHKVTVEDSETRCILTAALAEAGADIAPAGSWRQAADTAVILGLKELPAGLTPLAHTHIMFGHAFKGQPDGPALLSRFRAGDGRLLDLEYLTDQDGRRLAAFGYWAGFAGAGVSLIAYAAQANAGLCPAVGVYESADSLAADIRRRLGTLSPRAIVIGALGRVGTGARDMCSRAGVATTGWDIAETAHGGPYPEVLEHEVFLNCILAGPGCPQFVPPDTATRTRKLRVIGDIACDPGSDYNPVPVYDRATSWEAPVIRIAERPVLDVMAIDNLPSLLPAESSEDFAAQLLPLLLDFDTDRHGAWSRSEAVFRSHVE